jgi:hypothetical protein
MNAEELQSRVVGISNKQLMNRRRFLRLAGVLAGSALGGMVDGAYANQIEPRHLVLERLTIRLPRFTPALDGFRIALMSDHHLFPFTPRELLEQAVEQANALHSDLIFWAATTSARTWNRFANSRRSSAQCKIRRVRHLGELRLLARTRFDRCATGGPIDRGAG